MPEVLEKTANRLIGEKSPYLLQHAHNPVQWYPWCDEAFAKAEAEDKPIFLSIGYSTCHWCHVMERESFEDKEVAELLNRHFVSIKVDREERPDIDAVYMKICQTMTGSGGWPLTAFLTAGQTAFFAGTYFPKHSRYGSSGLMDILSAVSRQWRTDRQKLLDIGAEVTAALSADSPGRAGQLTRETIRQAFAYFQRSYDSRRGGFGQAPKFPSPHNLMFLMRYAVYENDPHALAMAENTLVQMYRGGIFDHIGHGFSRYSTDASWLVPHFEKMLYDNAFLTMAYLEIYQLTGRELFKRVAVQTLGYIGREMTSEEGGFYSAQDADSEGVEGKYYVWTPEEVEALLGKEGGRRFCDCYGITRQGNFEGASIPNLLSNPGYESPGAAIDSQAAELNAHRGKRVPPHKDDKILTAWNGMMTAAFARAYTVLGEKPYLDVAVGGAKFIMEKLTRADGRLYVRFRDGEAGGTGYLDDYAFAALAFLSLYEATFDVAWLERAVRTAENMCRLFEEKDGGGFYLYASDGEALLTRPMETYDGAAPSGNSAALYVLSGLAKLTGEQAWEEAARRQLEFMHRQWAEYPAGFCFGLISAASQLYPQKEVVCVSASAGDTEKLRAALAGSFLPGVSLLVVRGEQLDRLKKIAPHLSGYPALDAKTTYYVCESRACSRPFTELGELMERL